MNWDKAERESVNIAFSNKLVVTRGEKEGGEGNIGQWIKRYKLLGIR